MAVIDDQGVARLGVFIEAFRQEDVRTEVHRPAPELAKQLALHFDVLDVFGLRRVGNRRYFLIQHDLDGGLLRRIDADFARRAIEVAGSAVPLLAFAAVHRQFYHVTVGALKGLVLVEQSLHPVFAGRDVGNTFQREAEGSGIEHGFLTRCQSFHIEAENQLGFWIFPDLKARFLLVVGADQQQHPPVKRPVSRTARV